MPSFKGAHCTLSLYFYIFMFLSARGFFSLPRGAKISLKYLLLCFIFCLVCIPVQAQSHQSYCIGFSQITTHPALDKVCLGIMDTLKAAGYDENNTLILFENAQGNLGLTVQIAQKLVSKQPDACVAIGTPSAQALLKLTKSKPVPLVFASISDPVSAGLVDSLEAPGPYATGTRNTPCFKELLMLIKSLKADLQTLGVIFNPSEKNAQDLLCALKQEAHTLGFIILQASASNSIEVLPAAQKLASQVQAFLLLQDNTVASALVSVLKVAKAKDLPVFSSFLEAVETGALLALAPDEYAIGQQSARMLIRILEGETPAHLPVEDPQAFELYVNKAIAKSLQISLPDDLIQSAKVVYP